MVYFRVCCCCCWLCCCSCRFVGDRALSKNVNHSIKLNYNCEAMMAGGPQQQQRHKNFQKTRQQTENRQKKKEKKRNGKPKEWWVWKKGGGLVQISRNFAENCKCTMLPQLFVCLMKMRMMMATRRLHFGLKFSWSLSLFDSPESPGGHILIASLRK